MEQINFSPDTKEAVKHPYSTPWKYGDYLNIVL